MKMPALATLSLALAACSAPPGPGNETSAEVAPSGDVGIVAPTAPRATPSPAPAAATTFPAAFRGRWGMTVNDCDPGRDDNKGLMVVSADGITFYESRAKVSGMTLSGPTRLMADLAFSGEGQTWSSRTVLELGEGGRTLTRSEGTPAMSYSYRKCAA